MGSRGALAGVSSPSVFLSFSLSAESLSFDGGIAAELVADPASAPLQAGAAQSPRVDQVDLPVLKAPSGALRHDERANHWQPAPHRWGFQVLCYPLLMPLHIRDFPIAKLAL
jgi:hypothetical protein